MRQHQPSTTTSQHHYPSLFSHFPLFFSLPLAPVDLAIVCSASKPTSRLSSCPCLLSGLRHPLRVPSLRHPSPTNNLKPSLSSSLSSYLLHPYGKLSCDCYDYSIFPYVYSLFHPVSPFSFLLQLPASPSTFIFRF